jgi:hypothetical protein
MKQRHTRRVRREPSLRSLMEGGRAGRWSLRKPVLVPYELTSASPFSNPPRWMLSAEEDAARIAQLGLTFLRVEYSFGWRA